MEYPGVLAFVIRITRPPRNLSPPVLQALHGKHGTKFSPGKTRHLVDAYPDKLGWPFVSCGGVGDNRHLLSHVLCGAMLDRAGYLRGAFH